MGKTGERGIALPWEKRGSRLGRLFAGGRRRVVAFVVVVCAVVVGIARFVDNRGAERDTRVAIEEARVATMRFRADHGRCPRSMAELLHPPLSGSNYLREVPRDGWGTPLLVRCPGTDDPDDVDVVAAGRNRDFYDDDIPR